MANLLKSKNIYKLIVFIFLIVAAVKIRSQFVMLKSYEREIAIYNEKITELKKQADEKDSDSENTRKDNEDVARKDLKMYYPNETPYKGY